jgi:hypothetical protein
MDMGHVSQIGVNLDLLKSQTQNSEELKASCTDKE